MKDPVERKEVKDTGEKRDNRQFTVSGKPGG